jgi:hypothetical protein
MRPWKFFTRHAVCHKCGVHFEPVSGSYGNELCEIHRTPLLELEHRKEAVMCWAACYWERLEQQMQKERAEKQADAIRQFSGQQQNQSAIYAAQQAQAAQNGGYINQGMAAKL